MSSFRYTLLLQISILMTGFFALPGLAGPVVVQGDHVNLRAQSNLNSEVITQVNYGDVLEAVAVHENWVELVPPTNVAFWVHNEFLHDGQMVKVKRLNVRAGPGTNYSIVGRLNRNQKVEIVEAFQEWRRISPPEGTSIWIAREFVMIPEAKPTPTPVPTATPRPQPTPTPVVRTIETVRYVEVEVPVIPPAPEPTPTVRPPVDLDLVPLPGQGSLSARKGILKVYLLAGTRPSRFQLVRHEGGGHFRTVCYLKANEELLKPYAGQAVLVKGRDYWVTDEALPVMIPLAIEALGSATEQ